MKNPEEDDIDHILNRIYEREALHPLGTSIPYLPGELSIIEPTEHEVTIHYTSDSGTFFTTLFAKRSALGKKLIAHEIGKTILYSIGCPANRSPAELQQALLYDSEFSALFLPLPIDAEIENAFAIETRHVITSLAIAEALANAILLAGGAYGLTIEDWF